MQRLRVAQGSILGWWTCSVRSQQTQLSQPSEGTLKRSTFVPQCNLHVSCLGVTGAGIPFGDVRGQRKPYGILAKQTSGTMVHYNKKEITEGSRGNPPCRKLKRQMIETTKHPPPERTHMKPWRPAREHAWSQRRQASSTSQKTSKTRVSKRRSWEKNNEITSRKVKG